MEQNQKDIYYIVHIFFMNRICDLVDEYKIDKTLPTDEILKQFEEKMQICHLVKPEYLGELIKKSQDKNVESIKIVSNVGFSSEEQFAKHFDNKFSCGILKTHTYIWKYLHKYILKPIEAFNVNDKFDNMSIKDWIIQHENAITYDWIRENNKKYDIGLNKFYEIEYQKLAQKLNEIIDKKLQKYCDHINHTANTDIYKTVALQNIDPEQSKKINIYGSSSYAIDNTKNFILTTQEKDETIILCDWDRLNDRKSIEYLKTQNHDVGFTTYNMEYLEQLIFSHQLIRRKPEGVKIFQKALNNKDTANQIDTITDAITNDFEKYIEDNKILDGTSVCGES